MPWQEHQLLPDSPPTSHAQLVSMSAASSKDKLDVDGEIDRFVKAKYGFVDLGRRSQILYDLVP